MTYLLYALAVFWALRIAVNIISYAHLWWVKEYRWDRMIIHLRTAQGRMFWWPQRRRQPVSPKSVFLVVASCIILAGMAISINAPILVRLLLADSFSFPVTWLLVLASALPTQVYHRMVIARARYALSRHAFRHVIGITGSYSKTTVKDYVATILSSRYCVLKTEASKNSPIGIAEVLLAGLKPDHEMFVAEMGAYKRGEIACMARMVSPDIGIITAINEQHQDLFGTMETTMKAKYELVEGLTGDKIAIMNLDDPRVSKMASWAKRDGRKVWGVTLPISNHQPPISRICSKIFSAGEIRAGFEGIEFVCASGNVKILVKAPVIGRHQARNIVTAIAASVASGMTFPDAVAAAGNLRQNPKSLCLKPGINGSLYINDTFNNSPDSVRAALDVLSWGKTRKILVFQPMIELGKFASTAHASIGWYAASICDEIILTNRNFYSDFVLGAKRVSSGISIRVMTPDAAARKLTKTLRNNDAVLFKGKEAERVLNRV